MRACVCVIHECIDFNADCEIARVAAKQYVPDDGHFGPLRWLSDTDDQLRMANILFDFLITVRLISSSPGLTMSLFLLTLEMTT